MMRSLVLVGLLLALRTASAQPSPTDRVRAFAQLPHWSGIWLSAPWPLGLSGRPPGDEAQLRQRLQLIRKPPYKPEWMARYEAGMRQAAAITRRDETFKVCARSFPGLMEAPWMFEIAVLPEETLLVFENGQVRHVYTDGRPHPAGDDVWPTPLGDSVGHWEGDTLVIDTIARLSSEPLAPRAWVSLLSEHAHFIERLRMVDADRLRDELTIDDPLALARPWRMTLDYTRVRELDRLIPTDCTENDRNPVVDGKMHITP